jgi:hypothetical protein
MLEIDNRILEVEKKVNKYHTDGKEDIEIYYDDDFGNIQRFKARIEHYKKEAELSALKFAKSEMDKFLKDLNRLVESDIIHPDIDFHKELFFLIQSQQYKSNSNLQNCIPEKGSEQSLTGSADIHTQNKSETLRKASVIDGIHPSQQRNKYENAISQPNKTDCVVEVGTGSADTQSEPLAEKSKESSSEFILKSEHDKFISRLKDKLIGNRFLTLLAYDDVCKIIDELNKEVKE